MTDIQRSFRINRNDLYSSKHPRIIWKNKIFRKCRIKVFFYIVNRYWFLGNDISTKNMEFKTKNIFTAERILVFVCCWLLGRKIQENMKFEYEIFFIF